MTTLVTTANLRRPIFGPILLFSSKFSPDYETHIPTKPRKAQTHPRFPGQNVDSRRSPDSEAASGQGSRAAFPLTPATQAFTRSRRLLVAADFDRVFQRSKRSADRYFTVLFRPNGLEYPRVGLAIAKKRVRRAVDRNRIKRLIRESFRQAQQDIAPVDLVVLARNDTAATDNDKLLSSLERHWTYVNKQAGDKQPANNKKV